MTVNLKGFEYIARTFIPRAGLSVTAYTANDNAPTSPGTPVASTFTNVNGMWQFTGLADGLYDVKVDIPAEAAVKWYKGNSQISVLVNGSNVQAPSGTSANTVMRTTDGIASFFGKVQTADLAAEAAAQFRSITIGALSTPGGGGLAFMLGSALPTITTTGRPIIMGVSFIAYGCSATANSQLQVWEGVSTLVMNVLNDNCVAGIYQARTIIGTFTPSAGAHNYYLVWNAGAGTVAFNAGTFWALELK